MSVLIDVLVPGPWWNALTYEADFLPPVGARVKVPLHKDVRTGFVLGPVKARPDIRILPIQKVLDKTCVLGEDLWDLALWAGRAFLCGPNLALLTLCPPPILEGAEVEALPLPLSSSSSLFHETDCFSPWDEERRALYTQLLEGTERTLILFPDRDRAKAFFSSLPSPLRSEALLWPSIGGEKLWDAWRKVRRGDLRVVVAPPGGVFAPLRPDRIIVEEESNPAYVFHRPPRLSARSLAGRRALTLGAELVLGGRMPSAKTFLRAAPPCETLPDRDKLIFADLSRSLEGQERGVEGSVPLTISLLRRTRAEVEAGRHVLWLLDRKGEAGEVFCVECGHGIRCPKCGEVMRSEGAGSQLRCVRCGRRDPLPTRCPDCRGELWSGRRPGLEALASMAGRLLRGIPALLHEGRKLKPEGPSLILGTRGALALCDSLEIGLAAWLDLDYELRKPDHGARFQTFSMIWESYWRGRRQGEGRSVLMQGHRLGDHWRGLLSRGWERFWREELRTRSELELPPSDLMAQIDLPPREDREALCRLLEDAGLFVMDPGEKGLPLWVTTKSIEPLARALAPRFGIGRSRSGFPSVTLWTE